MSTAQSSQHIEVVGGLLGAGLLEQVASLSGELEGLRPESYGLAPQESLRSHMARAWSRLTACFTNWAGHAGGDLRPLRTRWLSPMFQELGYPPLTTWVEELSANRQVTFHRVGADTKLLVGLVAPQTGLDARLGAGSGGSPFGLLQRRLNETGPDIWGILTNGEELRLLRSSASLTRNAYISFDLAGIFSESAFQDFVRLFLLAHFSRFSGAEPVIERWRHQSDVIGTRALAEMRDGVIRAVDALGTGFLKQEDNTQLREWLAGSRERADEYQRALFHLVYRFLFVCVAEDRNLLHRAEADPGARERYARWYSTGQLRQRAGRQPFSRHHDAYEGFKVVMETLGKDGGAPVRGGCHWQAGRGKDRQSVLPRGDPPALLHQPGGRAAAGGLQPPGRRGAGQRL